MIHRSLNEKRWYHERLIKITYKYADGTRI